MKRILLCTLAMAASAAYADNNSNNGVGNVINDTHNGASVGGSVSNNNSNTNVNLNSANSSSHSSSNSNSRSSASARQSQGQSQRASSSVRGSGNSSNSYNAPRNPVSTAWAAPLVAADDTCSGSTSAGAQGVGFGLSLGSTWHDSDCVRRKDARELYNMGQRNAALALLCQSESVARAVAAGGGVCPGVHEEYSDSIPEPRHAEARNTVVYTNSLPGRFGR